MPFPELSPVDDRSLRGNTLSRRVSECASRVSTGATSVGRESSTLFSRRVSRHSDDDDVDIDERSARGLTEFLRSTEIRSPSRRRRRYRTQQPAYRLLHLIQYSNTYLQCARVIRRRRQRRAARGYWTTRGCHRRLCVLSFRSFGGICETASCPVD